MHILLSNDDGIRAEGIGVLYKALSKVGRVTVVAPDGERSSISQAITLDHPIYHRLVTFLPRAKGHALSGTPADCVKFALAVLLKDDRPDMIFSGVNRGGNDGCSVFYSGTVAAAREGALSGIPSVAVSLNDWAKPKYEHAALIASRVARWVIKQGLPRGTFLNVNVPPGKTKGLRWASQCLDPIHGNFERRKDPNGREYFWMIGRPPVPLEKRSDSFILSRGFATVTPVHCDSTDYRLLKNHDIT